MKTEITKMDPIILQRLGITEAQAQELLENGVTLAEYAEMLGADLKQETDNVAAKPVRWKIVHTAQAFVNESTGEMKRELIGVVPYFHISRVLFETEGQKVPTCSSKNGRVGQYTDETGELQTRACLGCPFEEFGSDPKGGKGKACKEMRRVFLLEEGKSVASVLNIPPTSLKVWDQFISGLAYEQSPVAARVIKLTLEKKQSGSQEWSVLKAPETVRKLSPLEYVNVRKMKEEMEAAAKRADITVDDYMQQTEDVPPHGDEDTPF